MGESKWYDWHYFESSAPQASDSPLHPLLNSWDDLERRERALSIESGRPFLLRPDFSPDIDVLQYFGNPTFRRLAPLTRKSYALSLRELLSYLESQSVDWRLMSSDHVLDYENWRRRDQENDDRLASGATFSRELAAFRHFLKWATARDLVYVDLEVLKALRPSNARAHDVKWLAPEAYALWRNVGMRGYGRNGLADAKFRGRNKTRNASFTEVMWRSGLRLREAGTLLLPEVPSRPLPGRFLAESRVGDAVAKGPGRKFWLERAGVAAAEAYKRTARALSVAHAQAQGRYAHLTGLMIIERISKRGHIEYRDESGNRGKVSLDNLDAHSRERVFIESEGKLEPAMLWLTESGMPMKYASWQMVFYEADQRCARNGLEELSCSPHTLRHSFALKWLVVSLYILDQHFNITPEQREYYRKQFGDGYEFVQRLLGHRSSQTTRDIYLAPAKDLPIEILLRKDAKFHSPKDLMDVITGASPRVQGVPE
ncbi:MAG: integrase [Chloroflexi bacterium]|nr:integrase [Chloroflexota bacterium]